MVRKKTPRKKTAARAKKSASKRPPGRPKKTKRAAKPVRKKAAARRKKPAGKRRAPIRAKSRAKGTRVAIRPRGKPVGAAKRVRRDAAFDVGEPLDERGLGPESGGQSGDTEGLSRNELAASESVEELLEEGQAFEAGVVSGVENAPDADRGPVRTRQVPEDDVPEEYIDRD